MKALRLKIAGWLDALEWWVSPYKKPGPKKRKAKQDTLMADLGATRNKESEKKFG